MKYPPENARPVAQAALTRSGAIIVKETPAVNCRSTRIPG
jgi:hypothetical protein